jgi:Tol biopolymer transport system component
MGSSHSTDPPARPDQESVRLESWKEIAGYLNRSVTTVQRWEQEEELPIHRLVHGKGGSVYALTHELNAWRRQRDPLGELEHVALAEGEIPNLNSQALPSADTPPPGFRVHQQKGWFPAAVGHRPWRAAVLAVVAIAALGALLPWPVASARITSVRTLVSDLERFGGLLRTSDACENPYATWSWASDDERVYFAMPRRPGQGPAGSYALYQVPIAGGEPAEISLPIQFEVRILDYVPTQSALLVRGTSESRPLKPIQTGLPLWLVSTAHGAPQRIPNLLGNWADVASDGRTLAVIRTDGEGPPHLMLAQLDGLNSRDLGPVPSDGIRPRWAPDGTRLRFSRGGLTRRDTHEDSIWESRLRGGAPRNLWPGSRGDWTTDGRYFVYDREEPGAFRQDLFAQREPLWHDVRARAPERLTVGPLSFWSPGVSRDGRRLFAFGRLGRGELMRLDPKTKTFAPAFGGKSAIYVEPSPDGEWLAWVRYPEGTLWKSRFDGSHELQLTSRPLEAHLPRWSADGRAIVFAARTPDEPRLAIYRVAADGSAQDVVFRSRGAQDHFWDPCWRRDGTLVFSRAGSNPSGILQLDPKTGRVTPLRGAETLRWPKCSRQGDLLAAAEQPSGLRFVVLRHDHDRWEDVGPATLVYPQWTRDGRSVCGIDFSTGRIDCLSIASKQIITLVEEPPFPLLAWVGAPWMGLDANDHPFVVADRSSTALYAFDWEQP